jgi:hypothetical protein
LMPLQAAGIGRLAAFRDALMAVRWWAAGFGAATFGSWLAPVLTAVAAALCTGGISKGDRCCWW